MSTSRENKSVISLSLSRSRSRSRTLLLVLLLLENYQDGISQTAAPKSTCKIKIFHNSTEVKGICAEELTNIDCTRRLDLLNQTDFSSKLLGPRSYDVEPEELMVYGTLIDTTNRSSYMPAVTVTWRSPESESARQNLDGYLLQWNLPNNRTDNCVRIQLNKTYPEHKKVLRFRYDMEGVISEQNYTFKLYSIPGPLDVFREAKFSSGNILNNTTKPNQWRTSVSIQGLNDSTVVVLFTFAPSVLKPSIFRVELLSLDKYILDPYELQNHLEEKTEFFTYTFQNYSGEEYSPEKPTGVAQFTDLPPGIYSAKVTPSFSLTECTEDCGRTTATGWILVKDNGNGTPRMVPEETNIEEQMDVSAMQENKGKTPADPIQISPLSEQDLKKSVHNITAEEAGAAVGAVFLIIILLVVLLGVSIVFVILCCLCQSLRDLICCAC